MKRGIGRRFDDGGSGVKYLLSQAPAGTDTSTFVPWAADYLGEYLLPDSITNKAILALGLRGTSLTNSAAEPMIRARRSSDNAERDFYAHELGGGDASSPELIDNNHFDTGDLSGWVNLESAPFETFSVLNHQLRLINTQDGAIAGYQIECPGGCTVHLEFEYTRNSGAELTVGVAETSSLTPVTTLLTTSGTGTYKHVFIAPYDNPFITFAAATASNGLLDFVSAYKDPQTPIEAWAGSGDAFVVTDYSAIGTNHATQSTAANQPKCVAAGVWVGGLNFLSDEVNGLSAISTIGTNDFWYFGQVNLNWSATSASYLFSSHGSGANRFFVAYLGNSASAFALDMRNAASASTVIASSITKPVGSQWINFIVSCDRDGNTTFAWQGASTSASVAVATTGSTTAIDIGASNANVYRYGLTSNVDSILTNSMLGTGTLTASEITTLLNYPFPK